MRNKKRSQNDSKAFITHQHARHAQRDIVLPIPSVRPSVRLSVVLCLNEWIYRQTLTILGVILFLASAPLPNSKRNPLGGVLNTQGMEKN